MIEIVTLASPSLNQKRWTENDIDILKEEYAKDWVNLKRLSKLFNRLPSNISRKARKLGLKTKYNRKLPKEITKEWIKYPEKMDFIKLNYNKVSNSDLAKITGYSVSGLEKIAASLGLKKPKNEVWERSPHPRGFLDEYHTKESKKKMSEKSINAWKNPVSKLNSLEHRQGLSNRATLLQAQGKFRNRYSRAKIGKRKDINNMFFRSSWEANYARYLNFLVKQKQIKKWEYEADVFWFNEIKRGTRTYTPDFKITTLENLIEYHEVKGWMDPKSKTKLKRMAKYYPKIKLILIGAKEYVALKKEVSRLIPNWE